MTIGFIGQGMVGKHYADDYEERGFSVVRYSLEEEYKHNKEKIKECDIVLVAVPTPTTPEGFDDSILRDTMKLIGEGKIVVIKSTLLPGRTEQIQKENPNIVVLHSPEFLTRASARQDVSHPSRNIIGMPEDTQKFREAAEKVMQTMPEAPFKLICLSKESELIKYVNNVFFVFKNLQISLCYEVAEKIGADSKVIHSAILAEPMFGTKHHTAPVNQGGRGAGGDCLPKDFEAFLRFYEEKVGDEYGVGILKSLRSRNLKLLLEDTKDTHILKGIYGENPEKYI